MARDVPQPEALPWTIGPYRVVRRLGRGGMAVVYEVEEPESRRPIALKLLTRRGLSIPRFNQEYRALVQLDHPGIVRVLRFGLTEQRMPYITMELLRGRPVQVHVKAVGRPGDPVRSREAIRVIRLVLGALGYLHGRHLLHRDIKSSNVMVLDDGRVKLLDLGTAREVRVEDGRAGGSEFVGTYTYASPEQLRGDPLDARSDLYSLGVLFYRMLTGRQPFQADSRQEVVQLHRTWRPPEPRRVVQGISGGLSALVMEMLEKDPALRPESAEAVLERLEDIRSGHDEFAVPMPAGRRLSLHGRDRRLERLVAWTDGARPGSIAWIVGARGSGRRAFLEEARQQWLRRGVPFLWGESSEEGDEAAASGLGPLGDGLAEAANSLGETLPPLPLDPLDLRHPAMTEGIGRWIEGAVACLRAWMGEDGGPALLLLPGFEISPGVAWRLLPNLRAAVREAGLRLVFVATWGLESLPHRSYLGEESDTWMYIRLEPRDRDEIEVLVAHALGHASPPPGYPRRVQARSGGRARYAARLVEHDLRRGRVENRHTRQGGVQWVERSGEAAGLPRELRGELLEEIARLDREQIRVLSALAWLGGIASAECLAELLELEEAQLHAVMAGLVRMELVQPGVDTGGGPGVRLVLESLGDLLLARPAFTEGQEALLLVRLATRRDPIPDSPQVCRHLLRADHPGRALEVALRWARGALRRGAASEVEHFLSEFLPEFEDRTVPAEVLARLVMAWAESLACSSARSPQTTRVLDWAAENAGEMRSLAAEVQVRRGHWALRRGAAEDAEDHLLGAHRELLALGDGARACQTATLLGGLAHDAGRAEDADTWSHTSLRLGRAAGGRCGARARAGRSRILLERGRLREAETEAREAAQALSGGEPEHLAEAVEVLARCLAVEARFSEALDLLQDTLHTVRDVECPATRVGLHLARAEIEAELFRLGQARTDLEGAWAWVFSPLEPFRAALRWGQGRVALAAGRYDTARKALHEAERLARESGRLLLHARARALHALVQHRRGVDREPLGRVLESRKVLAARGALPDLAFACACLAEVAAAEIRAEEAFEPVMRWQEREPAHLCRMWWLLARFRETDSARDTEERRRVLTAARAELSTIRRQLNAEDRMALRMHPWKRALSEDMS